MGVFRSIWVPLGLSLLFFVSVLSTALHQKSKPVLSSFSTFDWHTEQWSPPGEWAIPATPEGEAIRYGRELISNTAKYLGPQGVITSISNGMNCQNCHLEGGTKLYGNSFAAVASTYPKYRDRSGQKESIEHRINDCMERSLNGQKLHNNSVEMKAMVAYIKWLGTGLPKDFKPKGATVEDLPYLDRAADPDQGKKVYIQSCQRCHGPDGEGAKAAGAATYIYPPLWGANSYTVSAGMFRLTRLAGFIKNNMPFDSAALGYKLTNEQAWDVAAFINAQQRPQKQFAFDWPNISKKPVDYPFGPYADGFSEQQHKYGPFEPITQKRAALH